MTNITGYPRPTSIDAAVRLMQAGGSIVAGGTKSNRNTNPLDGPPPPPEVVDIQAVGLDSISIDDDGVATTLASVSVVDGSRLRSRVCSMRRSRSGRSATASQSKD